ncbi:hypothetical protein [Micromonospora chersina]|uniref:hypothetical protein n=1 Tax=Micromonospora chersina TaxID=47854 RepID=UPI0033A6AFBD
MPVTDHGEPLPGGFVAEVVRIGDTVRRTPPVNAAFVIALLRHLEPTCLAPRLRPTVEAVLDAG